MKQPKELAIVGAGIAGVSAAVYAKRCGMDFLLIDRGIVGGQLLFMERVDNYIGLGLGARGRDMALTLAQTLKDLDIPLVNAEIIKVEAADETITIETDRGIDTVKGLIIATGASFRKLEVPGEAEFAGKGISYCAVCDGFFFRGKDVVVIGGGNSALEEALYLADIARTVTLIHRRQTLRALEYLQKKLVEKKNITVLLNSTVTSVQGSEALESIAVLDSGTGVTKPLRCHGVFIAIGSTPNTDAFVPLVDTDEAGFILTDQALATSRRNVWACGDCRKRPLRQLVTAAGEGALAAMSAYKHFRGHYISS